MGSTTRRCQTNEALRTQPHTMTGEATQSDDPDRHQAGSSPSQDEESPTSSQQLFHLPSRGRTSHGHVGGTTRGTVAHFHIQRENVTIQSAERGRPAAEAAATANIRRSYEDTTVTPMSGTRGEDSQEERHSLPPLDSSTTAAAPEGTTTGRKTAQEVPSNSNTTNRSATMAPAVKTVVQQDRENFLLFIKILFRILEQAQEPQTKLRAQRIVVECRRKYQQGDPNFAPLMEAVQRRLRRFVGEANWSKAHLFMHHYMVSCS